MGRAFKWEWLGAAVYRAVGVYDGVRAEASRLVQGGNTTMEGDLQKGNVMGRRVGFSTLQPAVHGYYDVSVR